MPTNKSTEKPALRLRLRRRLALQAGLVAKGPGAVGRTGGFHFLQAKCCGDFADGWTVNTIRIWEVATGKRLHMFQGPLGGVLGLAFSPKGDGLVAAGVDGSIGIWDPATGQQQSTWMAHTGAVRSVVFSRELGGLLAVRCLAVVQSSGSGRTRTDEEPNWLSIRLLEKTRIPLVRSLALSSSRTTFGSCFDDV